MRLVLDTTAMVAAIRSDAGASRRLLVAALERQFTLLVSVPLLIEYQAVMTRPEHLVVAGLSPDDIGALLDAVALVSEPRRDFTPGAPQFGIDILSPAMAIDRLGVER
jgi:predicted nucleic acid-binding protein